MNISSVISFLKKYPLLVLVVISSVVLAIVFAVQNSREKAETMENAPVSATVPVHEPAIFATNSNGERIVTTTTTISSDATGTGSAGTTTTLTAAPMPEFQTVDDDYFSDALFIGNSRTVGLSMFGSMPEDTTFYATVGMNIYDLMDSSAQIPPEEGPEQSFKSLISEKQFGKIYIMLGINDLGTGTSESFAEYYKNILDQIHQKQPDAIIYIQSIINVSASRDAQGDLVNNASINEKNALLKELANNDTIFYLNVNEVLVDSNGCLNSDYTSDGVHLGGSSLPIWEDYLYTHAIVK